MSVSVQLACRRCGWRTLSGEEALVQRLHSVGMLRRIKSPEPEMILELLSAAATQLVCPDCEAVGLSYDLTDEADGWQDAVLCEVCRKPIPPERLDAMPSARRCVSCQNQRESGVEAETPDFCPKCGSVLVVRVSRGAGVTRYKSFCTGDPPCRL